MSLHWAAVLGGVWFLLGLVGLVWHETRERRKLCVGLLFVSAALLLVASAEHWGLVDGHAVAVLVLCVVPVFVFHGRSDEDVKQGD